MKSWYDKLFSYAGWVSAALVVWLFLGSVMGMCGCTELMSPDSIDQQATTQVEEQEQTSTATTEQINTGGGSQAVDNRQVQTAIQNDTAVLLKAIQHQLYRDIASTVLVGILVIAAVWHYRYSREKPKYMRANGFGDH